MILPAGYGTGGRCAAVRRRACGGSAPACYGGLAVEGRGREGQQEEAEALLYSAQRQPGTPFIVPSALHGNAIAIVISPLFLLPPSSSLQPHKSLPSRTCDLSRDRIAIELCRRWRTTRRLRTWPRARRPPRACSRCDTSHSYSRATASSFWRAPRPQPAAGRAPRHQVPPRRTP